MSRIEKQTFTLAQAANVDSLGGNGHFVARLLVIDRTLPSGFPDYIHCVLKLTSEVRALCDVLELKTGTDVVLSGELMQKDGVKILEVSNIALFAMSDLHKEFSSLPAMSNMAIESSDMGFDQDYHRDPVAPLHSGYQDTLAITEPVISQFLVKNPVYWSPLQRLPGGIAKPSHAAWLELATEVKQLNEQQRTLNPGKAWVVPFESMNKALGIDIANKLTEFAEAQGLQVHYIGHSAKNRPGDQGLNY